MAAFGHRIGGGRPRGGRQVVGDAGTGEGHQGLGGVAGPFLNIIRVDQHQARVLGPGPEVGLLSQAPQVLLKVGVEEDVEEGVETGRERADDQEDELGDLGTQEGEVQQGGEGQEGHGAVEDAVGEEQQGDVLHHGAVPGVLRVPLLQAAVEPGVGHGHHEEAQRVEQDQRDHVARGAGLPEGQRQAERRGAVLAAAQQRHRGHRQRQPRAQRDGGLQAGEGPRFQLRRGAPHREAPLQGRQGQQEHGRLGGKRGQEPHGLAAHALLPPRAVPREAAEGDRVHARQHGAGHPREQVGRRDQPHQQLDGGEAQGRPEHRGRHQGVAGEGQHGDGPHSDADQPAPEQVLAEFEGAWKSQGEKQQQLGMTWRLATFAKLPLCFSYCDTKGQGPVTATGTHCFLVARSSAPARGPSCGTERVGAPRARVCKPHTGAGRAGEWKSGS